jgi:hypothetical protein
MKNLVLLFAILMTLVCCTTEADRNRMRSGLDSINQRNRNDLPFTVQDVKPYVQFFDDEGTPNDRLLAHYLLGRAYYEAGEAPMALECYQKAVECADTLSKDCDYAQLCRVYAQMAQIFYEQGLYREQLVSDQVSVKSAWNGKDTLAALMSYVQESQAYRNLNMPDSLLYICEHVSQLYRKYGYSDYSARTLFYTFSTLIHRKEFDKVRKYMQIYEAESEYFDSLGNIQKGREIYYKIKGLYFLHTNVLDSAEYYFRKELRDGKDFNNQNAASKGLAELYQRLHQPDSVAKYSLYAYAMSDSLYAQRTAKEIQRIQAMYDYSRHQEIAHQEHKKANQRIVIIWICIGIIIVICLLTFIIIRELTLKRKAAEQKYLQSQFAIVQAQSDIEKLRKNEEGNKELISEKEQIIREQEIILESLLRQGVNSHSLADKKLKESAIYQKLFKKQYGQKLTNEDLRECHKLVIEYLPELNNLLASKEYIFNHTDYNVCMLLRLGFKSKEISNMLDISPGRVSQICAKTLLEIFGESDGGAAELIEKLHQYY